MRDRDFLPLIVGLLFLAAVGLLGFSAYAYLRLGVWDTPSLANLVVTLFGTASAYEFAQNWVGLWDILSSFPLWLALALLGVGMFSLAVFTD